MASPVFKTAWAAVRSPEGSTPFLLRQMAVNESVLRDLSRSAPGPQCCLGHCKRSNYCRGGERLTVWTSSALTTVRRCRPW